jgi:DNA-binding beta-propeller fold protein YncE
MIPLKLRTLLGVLTLVALVGCASESHEPSRDSLAFFLAPKVAAPLGTAVSLSVDAGAGYFNPQDSVEDYACTSSGPAFNAAGCVATAAGPGAAVITVTGPHHEGSLPFRLDSAPHLSFGAQDVTAFDLALSDRRTAWSTSRVNEGSFEQALYKTNLVTKVSTKIYQANAETPGGVAVDPVGGKVYLSGTVIHMWDTTAVVVFSTAGAVLDTLAILPGQSYAVAFAPTLGVYVGAGSTVYRLDPTTGAVLASQTFAGKTVLRIVLHPGTNRAFVVAFSGASAGRVAPVYELTLDSLAVLKTRGDANAYGVAVTANGGTLYYTSEFAQRVYRCTVGADLCTFAPTPGAPMGVTLSDDGTKLFVMTDGMVTTYDAATLAPLDHQVVQGLPRFAVATDSGPSVVFTHDRGVDLLPRGAP